MSEEVATVCWVLVDMQKICKWKTDEGNAVKIINERRLIMFLFLSILLQDRCGLLVICISLGS